MDDKCCLVVQRSLLQITLFKYYFYLCFCYLNFYIFIFSIFLPFETFLYYFLFLFILYKIFPFFRSNINIFTRYWLLSHLIRYIYDQMKKEINMKIYYPSRQVLFSLCKWRKMEIVLLLTHHAINTKYLCRIHIFIATYLCDCDI